MGSKHTSNQGSENFSNIDTIHIKQKGNELIIQMRIGYSRKNIRVEISNDSLSIIAATIPENIIKSITLPQNAVIEKARANYRDNVLTVLVPLRALEGMRMHIWHKPRIIPIE
ncbi:Hsp20/alpha crystallin family protein [Aneurinibacillus aneurinilyticus]|uniref:Hsp20/alpha crystallin family protein n=2 Tax=Aneurinibacillus aneurinilyticus TaxID=1391 RepID=A0A848D0C0_ANEAE|nr:Hsp20/alpha crystallin family protein [Aneurinibacillus aneurinilyticus]ERI10732.1 hypothetical protein HMPREF0083_01150 [Aneurinibacillus aneurinilyticus ATCC 12856]MCI1696560.1 Hsp20/alpha crystallin family protein [Aneurinibacillus aneurinilyticus]MED0669633.1 Hsp20/alpha crystallin family protein [Aneurinibacillus aneurinilyticus]MED0709256.1 Hsp20/alpha crystallin family protein [Aneurinibacillus aneurinilyticus]MED0724886.1 Hsp20/alpha crystallin family protein [Aneurinibacillus aneur